MESIKSPTMPGHFGLNSPVTEQSPKARPRVPQIQTQAINARPSSTYSINSAYFSALEDQNSESPGFRLSIASNAPFSALETEDDSLARELAVLESLRLDLRANLKARPLVISDPAPPTRISDDFLTAPTSPTSPLSPPSVYSPSPHTPPSTFRLGFDAHQSTQQTSSSVDPITPAQLADLLAPSLARIPLILDTRPSVLYSASHLCFSVNLAIPSLILKRCRKTGSAFSNLDSLKTFITTDIARDNWDKVMLAESEPRWSGDIVVLDEEMDETDALAPAGQPGFTSSSSTAWTLLPALKPLASGRVYFVRGGLSAVRYAPATQPYMAGEFDSISLSSSPSTSHPSISIHSSTSTASSSPPRPKHGLFTLRTDALGRPHNMPQVESRPNSDIDGSTSSASSPSSTLTVPSRSYTYDTSPSPSPSVSTFPRAPRPAKLARIDTASAERLRTSGGPPKLSLRTAPQKSATLGPARLQPPPLKSPATLAFSRSHPTLVISSSPITPTSAAPGLDMPSYDTDNSPRSHSRSPPPRSAYPTSPSTARPSPRSTSFSFNIPNSSPTSETPAAETAPFTVSQILPNFLYLGPEITLPEHVQELKDLGVKRILNMAAECDDEAGLGLTKLFKYNKIPMRDTVEEENVSKGVREVCTFLDDARLHSSPTYVHCKAGKSRSVTAVMAYLIHANHWPLGRAYAFVLERRKGISPNIGFVSELMNFEEEELGGKSTGVNVSIGAAGGTSPSSGLGIDDESGGGGASTQPVQAQSGYGHGYGGGPATRRAAHVRESLPPTFHHQHSATLSELGSWQDGGEGGGGSSGPNPPMHESGARLGDHGQEMEIKDSDGRYRHMRRAPVDELTLQPMRRVSKAGLESTWV